MAAPGLIDALGARSGVVCLVGAGGKKSLMTHLATSHPGRVGVTSTTKIPPMAPSVGDARLAVEPDAVLAAVVAAARDHRVVLFTAPATAPDRFEGFAPDLVAAIHRAAGFEATFVKADGARMRLIKAPGEGEPRLVPGAATILLIVSARAIGRPLDADVAHRPELIAALTGARPGAPIEAAHVARLIVVLAGRMAGAARIIPVINMADDQGLRATARTIAAEALGSTASFDRVVVTALAGAAPVFDIIGA